MAIKFIRINKEIWDNYTNDQKNLYKNSIVFIKDSESSDHGLLWSDGAYFGSNTFTISEKYNNSFYETSEEDSTIYNMITDVNIDDIILWQGDNCEYKVSTLLNNTYSDIKNVQLLRDHLYKIKYIEYNGKKYQYLIHLNKYNINDYQLPTANDNILGGVIGNSNISDVTIYEQCPIKDGKVYYKNNKIHIVNDSSFINSDGIIEIINNFGEKINSYELFKFNNSETSPIWTNSDGSTVLLINGFEYYPNYIETDNNIILDIYPISVQPDWNEVNETSKSFIKNKPNISLELINADWNATSGISLILNKPNLATVATSGSYNDLTDQIKFRPGAGIQIDKDTSNLVIVSQDIVGLQGSLGVVRNGSDVTESDGYTACPIINGIPYYKESGNLTESNINSIGITMPNAFFDVKNSPLTSDGIIEVSLKPGYSIPTEYDMEQWGTAYGWGDHSTMGYLKSIPPCGSEIQPIYIDSDGNPAVCAYELHKTVPENAIFTDTKSTVGITTIPSSIEESSMRLVVAKNPEEGETYSQSYTYPNCSVLLNPNSDGSDVILFGDSKKKVGITTYGPIQGNTITCNKLQSSVNILGEKEQVLYSGGNDGNWYWGNLPETSISYNYVNEYDCTKNDSDGIISNYAKGITISIDNIPGTIDQSLLYNCTYNTTIKLDQNTVLPILTYNSNNLIDNNIHFITITASNTFNGLMHLFITQTDNSNKITSKVSYKYIDGNTIFVENVGINSGSSIINKQFISESKSESNPNLIVLNKNNYKDKQYIKFPVHIYTESSKPTSITFTIKYIPESSLIEINQL